MQIDLQAIAKRAAGRALAGSGAGASDRQSGVHVTLRPCGDVMRPNTADDGRNWKSGRGEQAAQPGRGSVTASDLGRTPDGSTFRIPRGAMVTALAEDEARTRRIELVSEDAGASAHGRDGRLRIAIGCDHGGFEMKQAVVDWVRELGHEPVDFGTHDENAVDYPDFARAVGEAVAAGRCHLGICIDGAGIGSAMAANKVRGVRAANCWDTKTANNAREHNYANVLTLGGRMLANTVALDVVRTFLSTPEGEARHGKRVDKIMAIEKLR